jgi:hypothetical protein
MLRWLEAMCHPDGEIALFNDAAFGIAPAPAELTATRASCWVTPTPHSRSSSHLADSGYVRAASRDAVLIADVAPVGPDYLPGHAHADTLSFELSLFGQRTIVNGGTSRYGTGPEREAERGTPAHSTVTVDGENSSEVWAGFRVARRAKPFDLRIEETTRKSWFPAPTTATSACPESPSTGAPGAFATARCAWRTASREPSAARRRATTSTHLWK